MSMKGTRGWQETGDRAKEIPRERLAKPCWVSGSAPLCLQSVGKNLGPRSGAPGPSQPQGCPRARRVHLARWRC